MLNRSLIRAFSTKNVCILANSRQGDLTGSKIIPALKKVSGNADINFYGYGGSYMAKEGFQQSFDLDLNDLLDKTFHTYRKSKTLNERIYFKWNPFNLINKHFTKNGDHVFDALQDANVPKRIYQSRPNLVLNIGNEYLAFMMMEELAKYYKNSALDMPKRHMFTRFVRDFQEFTLRSIDYCHYTVPLTASNANGFVFPGEFVGQYGTYEALAHVYSKTESMRGLLKDDHLLVNKRHFSPDVEKAVLRIREQFRAEQNIEQDAYSIFIAPGNEKAEAEFCLENLRKGVKEFLLKYSSPTSLNAKASPLDSSFVTIISVHAGSEGETYVREYLSKHGWTGKFKIVTNEDNQHYDAMAASDFGFIQDGQMVSAANALHLPTNAMINMRMHQQWFNDYHNRWWNDMNIICDNNVNKELIGGELWMGKICDTLAENYVKPEARYQMIQKTNGFVQDSMSFKPLDRNEVRTKDIVIDGQEFEQYHEPFQLAARHMWADIEGYQTFGDAGHIAGNVSDLHVPVARI